MAQTKKSGAFNLPLMILSFVAIVGFLYWLSIASEPTELAVAEENGEAELGAYRGVSLVELGDGPEAFLDERVRLPNVRVTEIMGTHLFWFDLPREEDEVHPYLVRVDRTRVADDLQVLPEDVITLTGTVRAMSDSVVTAWEELGVFTDQGQRGRVEAESTFIDLDQVEIHTDEPQDDPGSGNEDA